MRWIEGSKRPTPDQRREEMARSRLRLPHRNSTRRRASFAQSERKELPMRANGRAADQLRQIRLEPGVNKYAEGSCLAHFGDTQVLCTASVENTVPPFLRNSGRGWVTAEYGMLPRATCTRGNRQAARGGQSGRTHEIQRLIGRSLRAVIDLAGFGERQVKIDCDVIQADGGTRTAAITGSYVALALAFRYLQQLGAVTK